MPQVPQWHDASDKLDLTKDNSPGSECRSFDCVRQTSPAAIPRMSEARRKIRRLLNKTSAASASTSGD